MKPRTTIQEIEFPSQWSELRQPSLVSRRILSYIINTPRLYLFLDSSLGAESLSAPLVFASPFFHPACRALRAARPICSPLPVPHLSYLLYYRASNENLCRHKRPCQQPERVGERESMGAEPGWKRDEGSASVSCRGRTRGSLNGGYRKKRKVAGGVIFLHGEQQRRKRRKRLRRAVGRWTFVVDCQAAFVLNSLYLIGQTGFQDRSLKYQPIFSCNGF